MILLVIQLFKSTIGDITKTLIHLLCWSSVFWFPRDMFNLNDGRILLPEKKKENDQGLFLRKRMAKALEN